jgi:hypothetical protein
MDGFVLPPLTEPGDGSSWKCLAGYGTRAVFSIYWAEFGIDDTAINNTLNAQNLGIRVSLWALIAPSLGLSANITAVIDQIINATSSITFDSLVFTIAWNPQWWSGNQTANMQYLLQGVQYAKKQKLKVGIYSTVNDWPNVMGDEWDDSLATIPVSYYHEDGGMNFDDWSSQHFGEWATPSSKDYLTKSDCKVNSFVLMWGPGKNDEAAL